ncbi:MAG: type IV pili methyl-accepting chemotaxis transducer N-terminal domain-containing protein [Pseudomonadota bacterium]
MTKTLVLAAVLLTAAAPLWADDDTAETRSYAAKHRLSLAEKQRALVEEISEAACMVAKDIETQAHLALIDKLRGRYLRVHAGLRQGDTELDLHGEETASKVLRAMDRVESVWQPHGAAVDRVVATGAVSDGDATQLFDDDAIMLEALAGLIGAVEGAYANPADMLLANAVTIDLAARQEMLITAIGKDVCLLVLGWEVDKHRVSLEQELALFQASHQALYAGMPAMGIAAAPTPQIKAGWEDFMGKWSRLRPVIDAALGGERVDDATLADFNRRNIALLEDLDAILELYERL